MVPLIEKEIRLYPLLYARAVLRHMGPEFWIVAIYPLYVSWVWASGAMLPNLGWLEDNPAGPGTYLAHVWGWLVRSRGFVAAIVVVGPLLGGATVLFDDYFDLELDRVNPRKNRLPFLKLPASPRLILASAVALFALSLLLAATVGAAFLAVVALICAVSVLYSMPPVRLKGRGGLDLLANVMGFGVLCSIAGWAMVRPVWEYPWAWLLPMALGTAALYIPTTVADAEFDGGNGVRTIAIRLGPGRAMRLGIAFLVAANAAILGLGAAGYLYSPRAVMWLWPLSALEVVPMLAVRDRHDLSSILRAIFISSSLMAIGTFMLMLDHVGLWTP